MADPQPQLILWTGPKHSGKTSAAMELVRLVEQRGFTVAGVLAPGIDRDGRRVGFDCLDLHTQRLTVLARQGGRGEGGGSFSFTDEGAALGREALSPGATDGADLVIVDEFGPIELEGGGWREAVDRLLGGGAGVIMLVVRSELVGVVRRLFDPLPVHAVNAGNPAAAEAVLELLGADSTERK